MLNRLLTQRVYARIRQPGLCFAALLVSTFHFGQLIATDIANEIVTVTVHGSAPLENQNYRAIALSDALRNAVQKGAGVNLLSQTQVHDFRLAYDQIFTASFGYIRSYDILEEKTQFDKIFRITINADVGPGTPALGDEMALRQLITRRGSPRIGLHIKQENILGLTSPLSPTAAWFKQATTDLQLNLALADQAHHQGNTSTPKQPSSQLSYRSFDYLIEVSLEGTLGREPVQMGSSDWVGEIIYELTLYEPNTGKIIAAVSPPGPVTVYPQTSEQSANALAFDAVHQALTLPANQNPTAYELFRKLFARYIADLEFGRVIEVHIDGLTNEHQQTIRTTLPTDPMISAVTLRRFDSASSSQFDIHTRLTAAALADRLLGLPIQKDDPLVLTTIEHSQVYLSVQKPTKTAASAGNQISKSRPQTIPALWLWAGSAIIFMSAMLLGRRIIRGRSMQNLRQRDAAQKRNT
jgi:hypothetical protein